MRIPLLITLSLLAGLAVAPAAVGQGTEYPSPAPTAALTLSPNPAYQGQVIVLDARASKDPQNQPLNFEWDIDGDGAPDVDTDQDGQLATAIASVGTHRLGVRVTDAENLWDEAFRFAQIAPNPLFTPPPADRAAPTVRLSRISRSLSRSLRRGIAVRLRCSEACVMGAAGTLARSTSRRYRIRGSRRNLSKANRSVIRAGSRRLVLKFSRTARRRLSKARAARVTLRFQVTDPSGNKRRVRRTIRLRR